MASVVLVSFVFAGQPYPIVHAWLYLHESLSRLGSAVDSLGGILRCKPPC